MMKKIISLLLIGTLAVIETPTAEANVSTKKATIEVASEKSILGRKRKRNRQRDGFFRRIFRKNKGCGCPKM